MEVRPIDYHLYLCLPVCSTLIYDSDILEKSDISEELATKSVSEVPIIAHRIKHNNKRAVSHQKHRAFVVSSAYQLQNDVVDQTSLIVTLPSVTV